MSSGIIPTDENRVPYNAVGVESNVNSRTTVIPNGESWTSDGELNPFNDVMIVVSADKDGKLKVLDSNANLSDLVLSDKVKDKDYNLHKF